MLRRLFKGRHQLDHPDAEVRKATVAALNDEEADALGEALARLLRTDPDPDVRLACVRRISDARLLETLLDDARLGDAAARRLMALAPPRAPLASNHPRLRDARLLELPVEEARPLIAAMDDPEALIDLAMKARGELKAAVLGHPALAGGAALTALEKRSRNRDKTVNRHARRQIERLKSLHHQADASRQRAEELAAALERHGAILPDQASRDRQRQLCERLTAALDGYAEARRELVRCGDRLPDLERLREHAVRLPEPQPPEPATPEPAASEAGHPAPGDDPFEPLVEAFVRLDKTMASGGDFSTVAAERQRLTEAWLTAADHRPPSDTQHQVFEQVSHRFRQLADAAKRLADAHLPPAPVEPLPDNAGDTAAARRLWQMVADRRDLQRRLERTRRTVGWPDWATPSDGYAELLNTLASLEAELAGAHQLLEAETTALEARLDALAEAIDGGHLQDAQVLLGEVRGRYDALPAAATRSLGKRLGKEAARLAELKDWQTFATTPKRQALLDAMETLVREPLPPRDQAERIKTLRHEWQALGPVTQAADGRLADRFNAEAERAFEPCRAYFAEQAKIRHANLEERQRICDQLAQYLDDTDWRQADMKAAERIMRIAREEWRHFHPVDRNPGKAVEERFETLQARLHDIVKSEWDRNLAAKEAIVAEAEALIEADLSPRDKTDAAKALQQRWREVGITPRRPDQRLWRAFREACDRVFSAREHARQEADAAVSALEARCRGLLEAFETTVDTLDAAAADPAALREFRHQAADIDSLPTNRRRDLSARRSDLVDRYRHLLDERARHQRRAALAELCAWDAAAGAAETAGEPLPAGAVSEAVLKARSACAGQPVPADHLRRLTLRAELAAGLPARPEDEALRLEIQVERLKAGLSGGGNPEDPDALADAWCRMGPKDASTAPLRERFFAALNALG